MITAGAKLSKSSIMVTAGANQAFVLTLCDARDSVVMFAPYYFNAYMSFQMTGITDRIVGPGDPKTLLPDVDWLEKTLSKKHGKGVPKPVTVVNLGNPSGIFIVKPIPKHASKRQVVLIWHPHHILYWLCQENKLNKSSIMIAAAANQTVANVLIQGLNLSDPKEQLNKKFRR